MPQQREAIPFKTAVWSGVLILMIGFVAGFTVERQRVMSMNATSLVGAPEGIDYSPVWKAWKIIDAKFVPAAVSSTTPIATSTAEANQDRVWGMIEGLAASLNDPYTFFLPPQQSEQFASDMSGAFSGVGMEIEIRAGFLTVVSPLKGSPAEKAGIKASDQIVKINGVSTKDMSVETAVKKIRGPKDTQVALTLYRTGWVSTKEFSVTRDVITVPIVNTKKRDDGIFLISVASFTSNSPDLFRNALREFVDSGSTRLILDLRGNPGGYLDAAVSMASWFLPAGKVVVTEDYAGHEPNIVHRSLGYDVFTDNLKMVILVDKGSASASEILADALRHWGKAKLVGTNTFGKGSVQELVDITPETSLKVTVARWLGPDGAQIPLDGIVPDVEATTTEELIKAGKDVQMEKAAQILLAM